MDAKTERKERTHDAILDSAAKLLRERGIAASSVADVMKGAGLTVGGFYAHFESKEALFNETLRQAGGRLWQRALEHGKGRSPAERFAGTIALYLSRAHRDDVEGGCLLPATVSEIARSGDAMRASLASKIEGFVRSFSDLLGGGRAARRQALAGIALMYGGLSLARALRGTRLSDEVLSACRAFAAAAVGQTSSGADA